MVKGRSLGRWSKILSLCRSCSHWPCWMGLSPYRLRLRWKTRSSGSCRRRQGGGCYSATYWNWTRTSGNTARRWPTLLVLIRRRPSSAACMRRYGDSDRSTLKTTDGWTTDWSATASGSWWTTATPTYDEIIRLYATFIYKNGCQSGGRFSRFLDWTFQVCANTMLQWKDTDISKGQ